MIGNGDQLRLDIIQRAYFAGRDAGQEKRRLIIKRSDEISWKKYMNIIVYF